MWSSSGIPSTKVAFLCAFTLQNPHFLAFRAQNRGFCVRMGDFSEILGRFDTKSAFLCAFASKFLPDGAPPRRPGQQQTSFGGENYSGLASNLAHLGRIC